MNRGFRLIFLIVILLCGCKKKEQPLFEKLPSSITNVTFENSLKPTPDLNILNYLYYYNGGGVAAADFNNDGLIDLYFTSNQESDKLYLNKGNLEFEDITEKSKIQNSENWTTGVSHVDINNDGLLDIYVCKVGNYKHIKGRNLLFVNQGIAENGIPQFKEDAKSYGLDFSGFSTQVAFLDYDLDGDLDMFLMNHSVHPNRTYGKGSQRMSVDSLSGDRLYKNESGKFFDVSKTANIYQGKIGYGLGLGISDLNNDGYPDIYVGNDFFENDYLYINQKDGTFKEVISLDAEKLGHTTHFSMGNDIADINNDGLTDIVSLDMLPSNLKTYKTSGLEYPYPSYDYYLKNGYAPQYMQNTLHLNLGNTNFSEIAELSDIASTDWSWGALLGDFDNDGYKDLFVSNGIKGATNDMDFINFIANDNIQKRINQGMSAENMSFIDELPEKKVSNYFFRNNGDLTFSDKSKEWIATEESFSNGSTYADLDNDGDLDVIVNNVNAEAYILENKSAKSKENLSLMINLRGPKNNVFGIGAKIITHLKTNKIIQENYPSRGYLSAVPPSIHMGVGKDSIADSLIVVWPGGAYQKIVRFDLNQNLTLNFKNAKGDFYKEKSNENKNYLTLVDSLIDFSHNETTTIEFDRDPLVPFANTNQGPDISVADVNNDGLEDIFLSGGKRQPSSLFIHNDSLVFSKVQEQLFELDANNEDTCHLFFDADGDEDQDLLVASGGNEYRTGKQLRPRLYINENGSFKKQENQFQEIEINASEIGSIDFDNDGDLDIVISSDQVPWKFGLTPKQYIIENKGNTIFEEVTDTYAKEFQQIGNVKDFLWIDLNNNGYKDLIVVGYWMPISIFYNDGKELKLANDNGLGKTNGWWNTIVADDFDNDGDIDLVAGNWGLNSKFKASREKPITLYSQDFDSNGTLDPLVTYFHEETETPFASKDELVKQMPFLNKKFLSYTDFSNATLSELFALDKLNTATLKKVYELRSMFFENDGKGHFKGRPLPVLAQASTIHDIALEDFDNNGYVDMFLVGNTYEISTQLGRMDASHGLILLNYKNGIFKPVSSQKFDVKGGARSIAKISINGSPHFIVGINNAPPLILKRE